MTFFTHYSRPGRITVDPGSKYRTLYELQLDPDGNGRLIESGEEDLYAVIQSHKESSIIQNVVRRYEAGDVTVLARQQCVFGDSTCYPKSMIEAYHVLERAKKAYVDMPVEARQKFGSFETFVRSFGDPDFIQKYLNVDSTGQSQADDTNGGDGNA